MSEDLWREKSFGTLRRTLTTSHRLSAFLAGKIAALAVVFALLAVAGITVAGLTFSSIPHRPLIAIPWIVGSGVGLFLMASLLQVLATEQRAGVALNAFVLFLLGMLGGTFFPFEMMPGWLAAIGRFTPNGWAIARFKEIIAGPVDPTRLAAWFSVLATFI